MDLIKLLCADGMAEATQKLFTLLFTLFSPFIKSHDYSGQTRHLLKLFLEHIKPCIFHITRYLEHRFYLTALETHLKERVPKDKYDLRNMVPILLD